MDEQEWPEPPGPDAPEETPRWRYMVIPAGSLDWVKSKAEGRGLAHGAQPGVVKGTQLFGALCTEDQWRSLRLGVHLYYERSAL